MQVSLRHEILCDKTQGKVNFKNHNAAATALDKLDVIQGVLSTTGF